ncbi:MAG: ROK family protein [Cardiobacteriaceae bacterium]|nr:ROK family protein [Cardiobacteriaceae bacterium]
MILTFDVGGTSIKSALYQADGTLVRDLASRPTAIYPDDNAILSQLLAWIREEQSALGKEAIQGVAIATAGAVNPYTGEIVFSGPTIPRYIGTPIRQTIEEELGILCSVENDVNAMALGEAWLGAAKGLHSALCITLGTGLGGALLMGDKLWHGVNFSAGEIGHYPIQRKNSEPKRFEELAATTALLRDYQERTGQAIDGKALFAKVAQGDEMAIASLEGLIEEIAWGLLPVLYTFAPQALIVGGGISEQPQHLEARLQSALLRVAQHPRLVPEVIRCATLGNRANQLGALRWFKDLHNR